MTGSIIPKYLLLTAALAMTVVGIMISVFYGQYRWLAVNLVTSSAELYEAGQAASFERQALGRLGRIANGIARHPEPPNTEFIAGFLDAMLATDTELVGIEFVHPDGSRVSAGEFETAVDDTDSSQYNLLSLSYDSTRDDVVIGTLYGYFSLASVRAESAVFRDAISSTETASRRIGFLRIGGAAVLVIFFSGAVIWFVVRDQSKRIRELKLQASKLSESDFGEPIDIQQHDEIGELAQVFNTMREKLRKTTISRDYVDKMLSGMNEAIIVTDESGSIIRVNDATTRMLEYEAHELLGKPIDVIVDAETNGKLHTDFTAGIPG